MDTVLLAKFVSAFVFVIALMLLLSWAMKRLNWTGALAAAGRRRLKVVEFMPLDHRRRLVLVRRDDREHLLLLGPQGETVVETGIAAPADNIIEFAKDQKHVQG